MTTASSALLKFKGYTGSVEVSLEDGCLHGRLLHIDDLITYGGNTDGDAGRAETIKAYFDAEVLPHVPDAWIDTAKTKVGYEIPFTRHFYKYVPPRPLTEIDTDLEKQVAKIIDLLREVER